MHRVGKFASGTAVNQISSMLQQTVATDAAIATSSTPHTPVTPGRTTRAFTDSTYLLGTKGTPHRLTPSMTPSAHTPSTIRAGMTPYTPLMHTPFDRRQITELYNAADEPLPVNGDSVLKSDSIKSLNRFLFPLTSFPKQGAEQAMPTTIEENQGKILLSDAEDLNTAPSDSKISLPQKMSADKTKGVSHSLINPEADLLLPHHSSQAQNKVRESTEDKNEAEASLQDTENLQFISFPKQGAEQAMPTTIEENQGKILLSDAEDLNTAPSDSKISLPQKMSADKTKGVSHSLINPEADLLLPHHSSQAQNKVRESTEDKNEAEASLQDTENLQYAPVSENTSHHSSQWTGTSTLEFDAARVQEDKIPETSTSLPNLAIPKDVTPVPAETLASSLLERARRKEINFQLDRMSQSTDEEEITLFDKLASRSYALLSALEINKLTQSCHILAVGLIQGFDKLSTDQINAIEPEDVEDLTNAERALLPPELRKKLTFWERVCDFVQNILTAIYSFFASIYTNISNTIALSLSPLRYTAADSVEENIDVEAALNSRNQTTEPTDTQSDEVKETTSDSLDVISNN